MTKRTFVTIRLAATDILTTTGIAAALITFLLPENDGQLANAIVVYGGAWLLFLFFWMLGHLIVSPPEKARLVWGFLFLVFNILTSIVYYFAVYRRAGYPKRSDSAN